MAATSLQWAEYSNCIWKLLGYCSKKHDTQVEVKKKKVLIVNIANTYEGMQQFLNLKQVTYLHVLNVLESHESKLIQSAVATQKGW